MSDEAPGSVCGGPNCSGFSTCQNCKRIRIFMDSIAKRDGEKSPIRNKTISKSGIKKSTTRMAMKEEMSLNQTKDLNHLNPWINNNYKVTPAHYVTPASYYPNQPSAKSQEASFVNYRAPSSGEQPRSSMVGQPTGQQYINSSPYSQQTLQSTNSKQPNRNSSSSEQQFWNNSDNMPRRPPRYYQPPNQRESTAVYQSTNSNYQQNNFGPQTNSQHLNPNNQVLYPEHGQGKPNSAVSVNTVTNEETQQTKHNTFYVSQLLDEIHASNQLNSFSTNSAIPDSQKTIQNNQTFLPSNRNGQKAFDMANNSGFVNSQSISAGQRNILPTNEPSQQNMNMNLHKPNEASNYRVSTNVIRVNNGSTLNQSFQRPINQSYQYRPAIPTQAHNINFKIVNTLRRNPDEAIYRMNQPQAFPYNHPPSSVASNQTAAPLQYNQSFVASTNIGTQQNYSNKHKNVHLIDPNKVFNNGIPVQCYNEAESYINHQSSKSLTPQPNSRYQQQIVSNQPSSFNHPNIKSQNHDNSVMSINQTIQLVNSKTNLQNKNVTEDSSFDLLLNKSFSTQEMDMADEITTNATSEIILKKDSKDDEQNVQTSDKAEDRKPYNGPLKTDGKIGEPGSLLREVTYMSHAKPKKNTFSYEPSSSCLPQVATSKNNSRVLFTDED